MRRQEPAGRLRPTRPTSTSSPTKVVGRGLLEHGRELHVRLAADRPSLACKDELVERLVGGARRLAGRRPAGSGDEDRPDDRGAAPRQGPRLHRRRPAEGARVVAGGERILEETGGYFVEPTIFDGVGNTMTIAREEIFGPVISTIPFDTEDEGVAHRQRDELRPRRLGLHERPRTRLPRRARRCGPGRRGQRLLRGRHHDAVRRLQAVGLRRPRQGPRGLRPVHREEDDLDRAQAGGLKPGRRRGGPARRPYRVVRRVHQPSAERATSAVLEGSPPGAVAGK